MVCIMQAFNSSGQQQLHRRRTKQEVCDHFVSRLQERSDIDITAPGFIESICQHFERLPTRYALDVNTESLDVLSHKRLLDEARLDPSTVSFAVRNVEVLHNRQRESSDGLPSPAFHEVQLSSRTVGGTQLPPQAPPLLTTPAHVPHPHPAGLPAASHTFSTAAASAAAAAAAAPPQASLWVLAQSTGEGHAAGVMAHVSQAAAAAASWHVAAGQIPCKLSLQQQREQHPQQQLVLWNVRVDATAVGGK
jgi:hypothetical protein